MCKKAGHVFGDSIGTAGHLVPVTCCRKQVIVEGPEELPSLLPRESAAHQYITIVAPVTADSKYDCSCQAADRKQNIIYCQMQPAEAYTWLPGLRLQKYTHGQDFRGPAERARTPPSQSFLLRKGRQSGCSSYFFQLKVVN